MNYTLEALLDGLIDYAGLFPPASLDMTDAAVRYARYQNGPQAWMLSRFVCPLERVPELEATRRDADLMGEGSCPLSLLVPAAGELQSFRFSIEEALAEASAIRERTGEDLEPDVLELKLPPTVGPEDAGDWAAETGAAFSEGLGPIRAVFVEVPDPWSPRTEALLSALAGARKDLAGINLGAKVRTGGVTPEAFPDSAALAAFVIGARDREIPFKATAGLHHPVPRTDEALGVRMHGFLNLFAGAILARSHRWDVERLTGFLDSDPLPGLDLDEEGIRFGNESVDLLGIRAARRELIVSIGSCSFEEPVEDLTALGLL